MFNSDQNEPLGFAAHHANIAVRRFQESIDQYTDMKRRKDRALKTKGASLGPRKKFDFNFGSWTGEKFPERELFSSVDSGIGVGNTQKISHLPVQDQKRSSRHPSKAKKVSVLRQETRRLHNKIRNSGMNLPLDVSISNSNDMSTNMPVPSVMMLSALRVERKVEVLDDTPISPPDSKVDKPGGDDEGIDIGSCLHAKARLKNNLEINLVLDTGAGVSIAGAGLEQKFKDAGLTMLKVEPMDLQIAGVNSQATIKVVGMVRLPIQFPSLTLMVPVVLVREWKGDALLSWRTLRKFRFNFKLDKKTYLPTDVLFKRYGVKIPLQEAEGEEVLLETGHHGETVSRPRNASHTG